jgi:cation:H+ antiporter
MELFENSAPLTIWMLFGISLLLVLYGGVRLAYSGDVIAEKTGIGRAWIGLVIISFATTLPELVTSVSSICLVKEPDLAAGNCFGSMAFNLLLVTFIDLFGNKRRLPRGDLNKGLLLSGGLFLFLLLVVLLSLFSLRSHQLPHLSIGTVDLSSFLIIIIYFVTTRLIFTYGKKSDPASESTDEKAYDDCTLGRSLFLYVVAAACVLAGGILLAKTANSIATTTGIGQTFIGSTMVGITTSLPEMVVAFSAIRLGAPEMVLGNVVGANLFNLIIVALCDFLYRPGILLKAIDVNHAVTIALVILMTCVVFLGYYFPPRKKVLHLGWDSLSLFLLYGIGVILLYELRVL